MENNRPVKVKLSGVTCGYGPRPIVLGVELEVGEHELFGLVGPNASGKSTLLRTISGYLPPLSGRVELDGRDLHQMDPQGRARRIAVVSQDYRYDFAFSVEEAVALGRLPYLKAWHPAGPDDRNAVDRALAATALTRLREASVLELSGGQVQRVTIARALAQEPELLILDEPTAHLDIGHQSDLMELVAGLNRSQGLTVIAALHDLNLAARYCHRIALMSEGRLLAVGTPWEVLTKERLEGAYGIEVMIAPNPYYACPHVIVLSRRREQLQPATGPLIMVIGGGGAAAPIMSHLVGAGFRVWLGVVNVGDGDWERARTLGVSTTEIAPFSPVTPEALARARKWLPEARALVLAPVPFGAGNLANLDLVEEAAARGTTVVLQKGAYQERDFTGGLATERLARLEPSALVTTTPEETSEAVCRLVARPGQ